MKWGQCAPLSPHLFFLLRGLLSGSCELLLFLWTHLRLFISLLLLVEGRLLFLTGLVICDSDLLQLVSGQSHKHMLYTDLDLFQKVSTPVC